MEEIKHAETFYKKRWVGKRKWLWTDIDKLQRVMVDSIVSQKPMADYKMHINKKTEENKRALAF